MAAPCQKVLIVGDDNFTLTKCIVDNLEQWILKTGGAANVPSDAPSESRKEWKIEVASCLPEAKIPHEYVGNLEKLRAQNIVVHFSVNPALLRQYFVHYDPTKAAEEDKSSEDGPPYDIVLSILPGLQFDGCPRYIERTSDLFKLRLHLYFFALTKSSTVITKTNGSIMFLWLDQEKCANLVSSGQLPFPLVDIHKLGPFCKVQRSELEDFRLNLSWGDYKTQWKPLIHNLEHLHFPTFLEDLKVYCFRNSPYVPKGDEKHKSQATSNGPQPGGPNQKSGDASSNDDGNFLRIPHTICQWDRAVLPHVNELFHFSMRTCNPGEVVLVSKLSVKYDPRITGWRNSGHLSRDLYRQVQQTPAQQGATDVRPGGPTQSQQPQGSFAAYPLTNPAGGWPQTSPYQSLQPAAANAVNSYYPATQQPNAMGFLNAANLNDFDSLIQQPAYETGWGSTAYWGQPLAQQAPAQTTPSEYPATANSLYGGAPTNGAGFLSMTPTAGTQGALLSQKVPSGNAVPSSDYHYPKTSDDYGQKYHSSAPSEGSGSLLGNKGHHMGNSQSQFQQGQQSPSPQDHQYNKRRHSRSFYSSGGRQGNEPRQSFNGNSRSSQWKQPEGSNQSQEGGDRHWKSEDSHHSSRRQPGGSFNNNSEGPEYSGGYNAQRSSRNSRYRGGGGNRPEPYHHRPYSCRGEERPPSSDSRSRVPR
eukprot:Blabericola_migrator_1__7832@NODE_3_length_32604_cov_133_371700_g2_i0_p7_GENE_NODE_3_length_32604_cov_133_371700_g2_i0NODE_3_length_32604_cov_133_371700_g2_i0_p7_ORF_typecomplete_len698_score85_29_NODE_3_length_32604_cov_133_371700_g2_i01532417417